MSDDLVTPGAPNDLEEPLRRAGRSQGVRAVRRGSRGVHPHRGAHGDAAAFAIGGPGPTFDTLGEKDGKPLVSIDGAPTYDSSGELRLTTVSVADAGGTPFTMGRVLSAWFSQKEYTVPRELVFGTPEEQDAVNEQSRTDWITSQESATVAALEELGHPVPAEITVAEVPDDSNAAGHLQENDIIVAIDGTDIETYEDLSTAMGAKSPGDPITVTVVRKGARVDETFDTTDDGDGNAIMGIYVDPTFDLPIDVTVAIDKVGGPSAGLMFSLGIMDKLTPEDELDGAKVAGTGTISAAGDVGPIGGIRMKMWGALDAGSRYFPCARGELQGGQGQHSRGPERFLSRYPRRRLPSHHGDRQG
ncbi:MAG: PDZ domain-containing protein [Demequina sp.]|nr:PDZ domain-containing protein [Demequina sp.]